MAAVLAPQVLATFRALFKGKQRATVFGVYGAVAGLAAAVGVTLGGVLTQANVLGLGWRAVFLVNVPVCVVILVVAGFVVPETRAAGTQHMDVVGSIKLAAGMVATVYPLLEGQRLGWPLWGYVLLAAGLVRSGRSSQASPQRSVDVVVALGMLSLVAAALGEADFLHRGTEVLPRPSVSARSTALTPGFTGWALPKLAKRLGRKGGSNGAGDRGLRRHR